MKKSEYIKMTLRGSPIALFAGIIDSSSMLILGKYTKLSLKLQVYISTFLAILISFFGHFLWTLKGQTSGKIFTKLAKFITINTVLFFISTEATLYSIEFINERIKDIKLTKDSLVNYLVVKKGDHYELNTEVNVIIKNIIGILWYLIQVSMFKFIF